ncbi:concanavalin A-like lectin/glucanase domain-containing protein [Pterulicium gracile]|uniref:Concanavalin A-like lectin/glucanase domain-containing protein n=1 Tax=Pterulicium gracile TaxID=1884261 RepID=A0A5C3QB33_9AGAR|nr:concanavalin A-like lectin/glucanase domain-containing protein [Pterula gracilis]
MALRVLLPLSLAVGSARAVYSIAQDYSGNTFFDHWEYYGNYDNLTNGHTQYLASNHTDVSKLTYINDAGNAIIKVDDFSEVPWNYKRNSIRLESKASYDIGSLWIIDAVHIPYGCSVWPAFWTKGGQDWPDTGEIDIIEYVNLMSFNQVALHTVTGCVQSPDVLTSNAQTGRSREMDCSLGKGPGGCVVEETKPNSNAAAFAQHGGGVFATQFEASGIFIWFWPRAQVPNSIRQSTSTSPLDIADFGPPTAAYPSSTCDIERFFSAQQLVLNIAICGDWADAPFVYNSSGCPGLCYDDNVIGDGSNYASAYWEIPFLRAYTNSDVESTSSALPSSTFPAPSSTNPSSSSTDPVPTGDPTPDPDNGAAENSALRALDVLPGVLVGSVLALVLPALDALRSFQL